MQIKLFDKVLLKDGRKAIIVEIYENGRAFEADIETGKEYITDTIKLDDVLNII